MATTARKMLGDARWWHIPVGALGAGVVVFVVALLFGADRAEAAAYAMSATSFGLAWVLVVALPLDRRARALAAIPVFLLIVTLH